MHQLQQLAQQQQQLGLASAIGMQLPQTGSPTSTAIDLLSRRESSFGPLGEQSALASGLGVLPGLNLSGLGGGMGGMGGVNSSIAGGLMGSLGGLGALASVQKPGEVAGLQHLLEAAQRYHPVEDSKGDQQSSKRFHEMRQSQHEEAAHA